MSDFKNGKWANKILSSQNADGSFGDFHTLSAKSNKPYTTESALRRLEILGFTYADECIKRAVNYMTECLSGDNKIPDRQEKGCNFDIFSELMLSAWILRFTDNNALAQNVRSKWVKVITNAFKNGQYSNADYIDGFKSVFGVPPKGGRLVDFVSFYQISMLKNSLDKETESRFFDYILNHKDGIYYTYEKPISILPNEFNSKSASRYLGAIELLCGYKNCTHRLQFVADWLMENKLDYNTWDMGADSKDGIYFPLSDKWNENNRIQDTTFRIKALLRSLQNE